MSNLTQTLSQIPLKREKIFRVRESGAYVQVFTPATGRVTADVNFFEGNRTLAEMKSLRDTLDKAIEYMEHGDV